MIITEFLKPGIGEMADLLPPILGRRLRAFAERGGRLARWHLALRIRSTTIPGFLALFLLARLRRWRPFSARFAEEQAAITDGSARILRAARRGDHDLALEIAACARLLKGYGETHRRGREGRPGDGTGGGSGTCRSRPAMRRAAGRVARAREPPWPTPNTRRCTPPSRPLPMRPLRWHRRRNNGTTTTEGEETGMFTRRHSLGGRSPRLPCSLLGRASARNGAARACRLPGRHCLLSPARGLHAEGEQEGRAAAHHLHQRGPRAVPPFEIGNAIRNGVVDMANTSAAFYANLLPAGGAIRLSTRPWAEIRQNGGWALINRLHNERLNALASCPPRQQIPFHLYTTREISGPDLRGWTIRTTPTYSALLHLSLAPISSPPAGRGIPPSNAVWCRATAGRRWASSTLGWHERALPRRSRLLQRGCVHPGQPAPLASDAG